MRGWTGLRDDAGSPTHAAARLMPTPAKLVAALAMAAVGWTAAEALVLFALTEGAAVGRLREIVAALGLVLGWRLLGRAATGPRGKGDRMMHGMTAGLTTALALALAAVLLHGAYTTIDASMTLAFNGVGDAVEGLIEQVIDDLRLLLEPRVLGVLFGGGALAGLAAGVAGRMWW